MALYAARVEPGLVSVLLQPVRLAARVFYLDHGEASLKVSFTSVLFLERKRTIKSFKRRFTVRLEVKQVREMLLAFGFNETQKSVLRRTLVPLKVMIKTVPPADYLQPAGRLAGDKTLPEGPVYDGPELEQPLLLLSGVTGPRMNQLLSALFKAGVSIAYKAVLTPTNRTWTIPQLYAEISEEHRQMHQL